MSNLDERITTIADRAAFEREKEVETEHWYDSPSKLRVLRDAVQRKATQVQLGERKFKIGYGYDFGSKVTQEVVDCIKLTPADGSFAPMGYIPLRKFGL